MCNGGPCTDEFRERNARLAGTFKRHPSNQHFHNILEELGALHDKKQRDYGTDEDPFNNIRASAREWGIPAWVGAMLRATDKVRRLQKARDAGVLANESVIDAFDDLAVYAVIARVMYEEDTPKEEEPVIRPGKEGAHVTTVQKVTREDCVCQGTPSFHPCGPRCRYPNADGGQS